MHFASDHLLQELETTFFFEILDKSQYLDILSAFYPNNKEYKFSRNICLSQNVYFIFSSSCKLIQKIKKFLRQNSGKLKLRMERA